MKSQITMTNPSLKPYHSHDRFFRRSMKRKTVRNSFFKYFLPKYIQEVINWEEMRLSDTHLIDDAQRESTCDLLFETLFIKQLGWIYLHLEHQSTVDALMAFRIWKYILRIMEQHMQAHNTTEAPIVYPLVFFTGQKPYSKSLDFLDIFGQHKEIARGVLYQPFQLIDITELKVQQLQQDAILESIILPMQKIKNIEKTLISAVLTKLLNLPYT